MRGEGEEESGRPWDAFSAEGDESNYTQTSRLRPITSRRLYLADGCNGREKESFSFFFFRARFATFVLRASERGWSV